MGTSVGWGSGWPTGVKTSDLATVIADRSGTRVTVQARLAVLVDYLVDETEAGGYLLDQSQTGGYVNRSIAGTSTPSNHSRGTAIDLNWRENPFTSNPHAKHSIPMWVVELWESRGFQWGGRWSGKKDFMHMELLGTPDDAARRSVSLEGDTLSQAEVNQIIDHIDKAFRNAPEQFLAGQVQYPIPGADGQLFNVPVFDLLRYTDVRAVETLATVKAQHLIIEKLAQANGGIDSDALMADVRETIRAELAAGIEVHVSVGEQEPQA